MIKMIINTKQVNKLFNMMEASLKVSKSRYTVIDLRDFIHTVNEINATKVRDSRVGDNNLSDYRIDSRLKELILPRTVTLGGTDQEQDLRFRGKDDINNGKLLDPDDFEKVQRQIFGGVKDEPNLIDVLGVKNVDALLTEYAELNVVDGCVQNESKFFRPVALSFVKYHVTSYNIEADRVFVNWFVDKVLSKVQK